MKGFAEVVEIPETKKDEKYIFGTIKNNGDSSYVTFDGSDFLTPITSAMGYEDGDRVMVMVKSHRAIVVNNMTSPAVTGKYVKENYASFENLSATNAQIGYLRANMITADVLEAKIGEFGYLKADQADLKFATIENLNASNAEISTLKATTIKTDNLAAEVAKLGYAEITDLNAATGRIDTLESTMITADVLEAKIGEFGYLKADQADIRYLTASTANTTFLHADMSDMDIAKIQTLFATAGIVSDMTIKDGHITGVLDSVTVNANSITTGTLSVDRLVIRGSEKSLVYELNNISGALQAKSVDTLNGEILTQRTVTADKLVAKSITSNEIETGTITSDEIAAGTIKAANINVTDLVGNSAFIDSLKSNTVIVGLQNDINGISVGGRNLLLKTDMDVFGLGKWNTNGSTLEWAENGSETGGMPLKRKILKLFGNIGGIVYNDWIPLKANTVYTYSAMVYLGNDANINMGQITPLHFWVRNEPSGSTSNLSLTTIATSHPINSQLPKSQWIHIWSVYKTPNSYPIYMKPFIWNVSEGNTFWWGFKLEEGNRATDWTPAPEDVDSLISAAQSTADSANSLAGTANSAANTALGNTNRGLNKWIIQQYSTSSNYYTLEGLVGSKLTPTCTYEYNDSSLNWTGMGQDLTTHYTGYAKTYCLFSAATSLSTTFYSDDAATLYVNGVKVGQNTVYGNSSVTIPFKKGWNVIEVVWHQGDGGHGFYFGTSISVQSNCSRMDCYAKSNAQDYYSIANSVTNWCYNNDITYINGGKIYTGTVTADKINVSSLSAISANIGTVTAGTIQSNNYVKDVSGMKLSLADGSWDSKYTKIDASGKITCSNIGITGGSIDLTGDTGDTVLVNIKKGNTTLKLSPNGIDQRNYNGNAGASDLKSETRIMSLKNRRIEINDTQAYSTYDIFSSAVIDIMAHADGGKTSLELHDNNGSTRVLTSSILTSKELSFSNNKKTWTVGISGTIPELLVSCDSTKILKVTESGIKITGDITTSSGASLNTINSNLSSARKTIANDIIGTTAVNLSAYTGHIILITAFVANNGYLPISGVVVLGAQSFISFSGTQPDTANLISCSFDCTPSSFKLRTSYWGGNQQTGSTRWGAVVII